MKHFVLEDSSFVIAVMDPGDVFHRDAVFIFKKILECKDRVIVLIPSVVFFESIVTLIRKGISHSEIEDKFWKLLHLSNVINVPIIETMAFKLCKRLSGNSDFLQMKTSDFVIANVGMEFDAQILTFDKGMRKRVFPTHNEIYYCSSLYTDGESFGDETSRFISDMEIALGEDIPF